MLLCNFLRINPQLVVQKLPGHKYTISEFVVPFFAVGANTASIFREKTEFSVQAVD